MSARWAIRVAWLCVALVVALVPAALALLLSIPEGQLPEIERLDGPDVAFALAFLAYAAIGALIAARHPRNPVGWLVWAFGVAFIVSMFLDAYVRRGRFGGGLPADEEAAWVASWSADPLLVGLVFLLLLFPSGRFLSARWRLVGFVAGALALVWAASLALDPGRLHGFEYVLNPVGIEAAGTALEVIAAASSYGLSAIVATAALSVVIRFRRARRAERQQIKWLALAALVVLGVSLSMAALELAVDTNKGLWEPVTSYLALVAVSGFPVAIGIAILRHGLYDIDVVINRTLVYGALTAVLGATYLGLVLLLQLLSQPLTQGSDLAIAGSTLAVAALFRPARRRIQQAVDRRFYRRKYDAERTLAVFSARLREEIDLDSLAGDLQSLVRETMQPRQMSVWLRPPEGGP